MMRNIGLIFLGAALLFSQPGHSVSEPDTHPTYFLTYDQYLQLPSEAQTKYIQTLQEFVVGLSPVEKSVVKGSGLMDKGENFWSLIIATAEAEYESLDRVCKLTSAKGFSMEELASAATQTGNCTEISVNGSPQYFRPVVLERLRVIAEEISSRMKQGKFNINDPSAAYAAGDLSGWVRQFEQRPPRSGYDRETFKKLQQMNKEIGDYWETKTVVAPHGRQSHRIENPLKATLTLRKDFSEHGARCLNAGFVIPVNAENTCKPIRKLPKEMVLAGIDNENFKCLSPNEIICNPLIFGYEASCKDDKVTDCKNAKPLCIAPSQQATKDCFELAKSRGTLEKVKLLFAGKGGREAYQKYIESLHSLCDPVQRETNPAIKKFTEARRERIKKDIEATCKVSFEVLSASVTKNFLPKEALQAKPAFQKVDSKTSK